MTVAGIIEQFNAERPNQIQDDVKVYWLRKCEQMLINEVLISHEHDLEAEGNQRLEVSGSTLVINSAGSFVKHIDDFDMDSNLIAEEPYDDLYLHYLDQRLAYNNNDMKRYNAAAERYNSALLAFQQYVNRTYITKKVKSKLIKHEVL